MAKSAIRHNMAEDLPKMKLPSCIIWGKNDNVTPPEVADEFHKLLPNSKIIVKEKHGITKEIKNILTRTVLTLTKLSLVT